MTLAGHLVVAITIIFALGLGSMPVGQPFVHLWPDWVLLTLTYWSLAAPNRYGMGLAFIAGIFQDVATATLLGVHAFVYVLAIYLVVENHLRIRILHLWGQTLVVFLIALGSAVFQLGVAGISEAWLLNVWALIPPVTTALLWAPIFLFLRRLRQRFQID